MKFHELASVFPMMCDEEFDALKKDIQQNGLHYPIWTYRDTIIDGRNRWKACQELKLKPTFKEWSGKGGLLNFVISSNLHRRHLTATQKATVAVQIEEYFAKEAKERQKEHGETAPGKPKTLTAKLPEVKGEAAEAAGKVVGVSARYVREAKKIKREAPEKFEKLRTGELTMQEATGKNKGTIAIKWTGDAESYTPSKYIEMAREVMGSIDTDPASNEIAQKTVKAKTYYTLEDNGLEKEWKGNIFLNPPYSHPEILQFVEKLLAELTPEKQAVLLTNNNTDTMFFHSAAVRADAICFTKGRINFYKADGSTTSPTNGQCFFYFGKNPKQFIKTFADVGLLMRAI